MTTCVLDKLFNATILQRFGHSLAILQGLLQNRVIAIAVNQSLAKLNWFNFKLEPTMLMFIGVSETNHDKTKLE